MRASVRHASATDPSRPCQHSPTHYAPVKADSQRGANVQWLRFPAAATRERAHGADDVVAAEHELERGAPFCENPQCALHVRLQDLHVEGGGNWVSLPDGRTFGRCRFGGRLLCDACGTRRGPVRLSAVQITN
jgi:hypothetical protein